jgi:hypothetical protein
LHPESLLTVAMKGIPAKKWRDQPRLAERVVQSKAVGEDEEKNSEHVQMEKSL